MRNWALRSTVEGGQLREGTALAEHPVSSTLLPQSLLATVPRTWILEMFTLPQAGAGLELSERQGTGQ